MTGDDETTERAINRRRPTRVQWRRHGDINICLVDPAALDMRRAQSLLDAVQRRRPEDKVSLWLRYSDGYHLTIRVGLRDSAQAWGDSQSVAFDDLERMLGLL